MSKSFLFKIVLAMTIFLVALFWVLNVAKVEAFEFFNGMIAAMILTGVFGFCFLIKAIFGKDPVPLKKLYVFIAIGMFVLMTLTIILHFSIEDDLILPIIVCVVAVGLPISVIAVRGKKWDEGDNKKVGYKNYYQRKKEQEEAEAKKKNND